MKTVLFYRRLKRLLGHHLKVWHYFNHVRQSGTHVPRVVFAADSRWDAANPWLDPRHETLAEVPRTPPDVIFTSGRDWQWLGPLAEANPHVPVINLIQDTFHADPQNPRYEFLARRAIRICVSQPVADAISRTGRVVGPVLVSPNAIDISDLPPPGEKTCDLIISAAKRPDVGAELARRLAGEARTIDLLTSFIPRPDYLARLSRARVAVTLPREHEGFHLPALEAMALGAIVVCPDCVGNRDFCLPGENCFRPTPDAGSIFEATRRALALVPPQSERMREAAQRTVQAHSLRSEREKFVDVLRNAEALWAT